MRRVFTGIVIGVAAVALAGCGKTLKASNTAGPWPFTVEKVELECAKDGAIFVKNDGKFYPLNGEAERRADLHKPEQLATMNDILKVDPELNKLLPGARMSLENVLTNAVKACAKKS